MLYAPMLLTCSKAAGLGWRCCCSRVPRSSLSLSGNDLTVISDLLLFEVPNQSHCSVSFRQSWVNRTARGALADRRAEISYAPAVASSYARCGRVSGALRAAIRRRHKTLVTARVSKPVAAHILPVEAGLG